MSKEKYYQLVVSIIGDVESIYFISLHGGKIEDDHKKT